MSTSKKTLRILDERVESSAERTDTELDENPYWMEDGEEPVPSPEEGCVRRGACCRTSPGWFGPGEVESAAAALEMTAQDFAKKYVVIDSIEIDGEAIEVFAPLKLDRNMRPALKPLSRADNLYRYLKGQCIFYKNNGCRIYTSRPIECRHYFCGQSPDKNLSHESIGRMWRDGGTSEQ